jgi:hypothetical protein
LEPPHALFGGAVRKGVRDNATLRPRLNGVIADLIGGAHRFLDISAVKISLILVSPYARQKIRLQL